MASRGAWRRLDTGDLSGAVKVALVADFLARGCRQPKPDGVVTAQEPAGPMRMADVVVFLREAKVRFGRYWRKAARVAGAEAELADTAVRRLEKLHLVERDGDALVPLLALARFSLGEAEVVSPRVERAAAQLFDGEVLELT